MSKQDHKNCKKISRWYQTCPEIWNELGIMVAQERKKRGIAFLSTSEFIDELIIEKSTK